MMKTSKLRVTRWVAIAIFLGALALTGFSHSVSQVALTVNNNSGRDITHIYFSSPNDENWSGDQLNSSVLGAGSSVTLNLSCNAQTRVIAEDRDGCFAYQLISCGETASWTITSDTPRDCGN